MPESFGCRLWCLRLRPVLRVQGLGLLLGGLLVGAADRSFAQPTAVVKIHDIQEISNPKATLVLRSFGGEEKGNLTLVLLNNKGLDDGRYLGSFSVVGKTLTASLRLQRWTNSRSYTQGRLELPRNRKLDVVLKEETFNGTRREFLEIGAIPREEVVVRKTVRPQNWVEVDLPVPIEPSVKISSEILQQNGVSASIDCLPVENFKVLRCSPKESQATSLEGTLESKVCTTDGDGSEKCEVYFTKMPVRLEQDRQVFEPKPLAISALWGAEKGLWLVLSGSGVKVPTANGTVTWETTPPNALQPAKVSLYVGPDKSFQVIVSAQCPSEKAILQKVTLTLAGQRDEWQSMEPVSLCLPRPPTWEVILRQVLEVLFTVALLASLIFLGRFLFTELRKGTEPGGKKKKDNLSSLSDLPAKVQEALAKLDALDAKVQNILDQVAVRWTPGGGAPIVPPGPLGVGGGLVREQSVEQVERVMLDLVNSWWQEGGKDRRELSGRIQRSGLPLQQYRSVGLNATLTVVTNRTFGFAPATEPNPAEWLWYSRGDREALALPLDARLFEAGSAMVVVALLFEGLGNRPPAKLSFRRADRACRLTLVPGERDRYSLNEPGRLQVNDRLGQPLKDLPFPPAIKPGALPTSPISKVSETPDPKEFLESLRALLQRWESPYRHIESLIGQLQALTAERNQLQELPTRVNGLLNTVEQMRDEIHDLSRRLATAPSPPGPGEPPGLAPRSEVLTVTRMDEGATLKSTGADFSRELTRQIEPDLAEAIVAEAKELRDRLQPILANLPVPSRVDLRSAMYLERLTTQWDRLSLWQDWEVDLVRFQAATGTRHTGFLRLAEARKEGAGRFRAEGVLYEEAFTIQLALRIRDSQSRCIGLLVAPGAPVDKYRDSFSRLTCAQLPDGPAMVGTIRSPAILHPEPEHGTDIWQVILPLDVELV